MTFITAIRSVPRRRHALAAVLLGALWALTTAAWYVVFVAAVDRGRSVVSRPAVRTGLHALTGLVLIALGAGVALGV